MVIHTELLNMQFITNGPDIPDTLLQAHEEGKVVFFCGAGISYPAGLPGFSGLVDEIYQANGEQPNDIEQSAIKSGRFDTAIGLFEERIADGRNAVRQSVANILAPRPNVPRVTATHEALLELSRTCNGQTRLITSNFDRLFEEVIESKELEIVCYQAPLLPVPKNRWDGLVYLHGLLSSKPIASELAHLVLSSGDFGLAYLTERWAARFVSDLFHNYTVCFVGYSINDPVLRYMTDALAADRLRGESPLEMFAFGSYRKNKQADTKKEWLAKHVTPVLYPEHKKHAYLHRTLKTWAETYRDGVQGKERIVVDYAMMRPLECTGRDDFVGRMLWALSDTSGLPAKRFADFDPAPSLDWLQVLSEDRYQHADLIRFGVMDTSTKDEKLVFSLLCRHAPSKYAPFMTLVSSMPTASRWDDVMSHLARWLTRHLNDPNLMLWLIQHGGILQEQFILQISNQLSKLVGMERDGENEQLARIRASARNAIPNPEMRKLWHLLLAGRVKATRQNFDLYGWKNKLERNGYNFTLRLELRELLAPKIMLRRVSNAITDEMLTNETEPSKARIGWDLVLTASDIRFVLNDLEKLECWRSVLVAMMDDFQQLLHDALNLLRELGDADDRHDPGYGDLPSISTHWQNRGFHDWVSLVELLRDAWIATHQDNPIRAGYIVQYWLSQPYPTFRRLALFAATYDSVAPRGEWVDWLLEGDGWWLWAADTKRETMRLLALKGLKLPDTVRSRLEASILPGPPREMFRPDLTPEQWDELTNYAVWLRLAKLGSGNNVLSNTAQDVLITLSAKYPELRFAADEQEEFSRWMRGTGDPGFAQQQIIEQVPRTRNELVNWLQAERPNNFFYQNDWGDVCRGKFATVACAFYELSNNNCWPIKNWREALYVWSEEKLARRSWRYIAPLLQIMPDNVLLDIASSAAWWLDKVAKTVDRHEAIFIGLCRRLLSMQHQNEVGMDRPVHQAINHPIGHVTQALLHFWYRRNPNDNQGLPDDLKILFTALCNTNVEQYRHGRVMLSTQLISLFRVDKGWVKEYLLPLFHWHTSNIETRAAWEGFLWSPYLYRPLFEAFKSDFLETAQHYEELDDFARQYATLLTYAAVDAADIFAANELRAAINYLPLAGLQESVLALINLLESAGEQREQYWENRIQPFWQKFWPKSKNLISSAIAEQLARLIISTRHNFPAALVIVLPWLQPVTNTIFITHLLRVSGLCKQFPEEVLTLLNIVVDVQSWEPLDLKDCLDEIIIAMPSLSQNSGYKQLMIYVRQHAQG